MTEPATRSDIPEKPRDWDKAVSAAYMWLILDEVKGAAEAAGVGERTMHGWIRSDWWPDACREAERRWLQHVTAEARRTVMKAVRDGNSELAMRILERRDPELAPLPKEHRVGILSLVAHLPPSEIDRLEGLTDEELVHEVQKLEPGG